MVKIALETFFSISEKKRKNILLISLSCRKLFWDTGNTTSRKKMKHSELFDK